MGGMGGRKSGGGNGRRERFGTVRCGNNSSAMGEGNGRREKRFGM